ncbi:MAG: Ku protein [Acidimicrobiales bacterium]|nr:Ku protein [Acidimicrobiales bacterium]MBO0892746.1 Ku protein [Acidimicrobiales bacterium]
MARPIWSGSVSFGLVTVPVKVYAAVRHHDLRFHQLEEGTGARIRNRRVSERTGKEVRPERIVRGYEVSRGTYVTISDEELSSFRPEATRTIELEDFVDLEAIDPIYFNHSYYLAPDGELRGAKRAYDLLVHAMEDRGKVGIGRVVMRAKQYLAALRAAEGALVMSTMLFEEEVVPRKEIEDLPSKAGEVPRREAQMAAQLVDALATAWDPSKYEDTYRDAVLELIDRKAKGEKLEPAEVSEAPSGKVLDLMAALEASMAEAGEKGPRRRGAKKEPDEEAGTDEGLEAWSRDELYEEAQRRGVAGRSKMSRGQLIKALQGARSRKSA